MGDRDRLIELLKKDNCPSPFLCDEKCKYANLKQCYEARTADHLIANGVIAPPCKVGDTFYGVNETSYDAYCVYGFKWGKRRGDDKNVLIVLTTYDMEFVWGEEAFLTPEEAEKALERSNNNA